MDIRFKPILKGALTFLPGPSLLLPQRGTGGTDSAGYCYEVWMKHLVLLWQSGMRSIPDTVAELGPGDSLGIGLAALLSGVNNYYALDIVKYSNSHVNLQILDELLVLFQLHASRPAKGWPDYDDYLDGRLFPSHILTDEILSTSLAPERISLIRQAILSSECACLPPSISYVVPWSDKNVIRDSSVDVIISHAVLEHVANLENTYKAIYSWLKPGGYMSHQIDFSGHGLSKKWNGHWTYPEMLWKITLGKRPFLINREPCSAHIDIIKESGFDIVCELKKYTRDEGIQRAQLSKRWKTLSEDDLACSAAFIQARK